MDGKSLAQKQVRNGVRAIVADMDSLQVTFGFDRIAILTPRVETRLRLGELPRIHLRIKYSESSEEELVLEFPVGYPEIPLLIELTTQRSDRQNILESLQRLSASFANEESGYAVRIIREFQGLIAEDSSLPCDEEIVAISTESETARTDYLCRVCRSLLCTSNDLDDHESTDRKPCTSIFTLEPLPWMRTGDGTSGKLTCPKCTTKLGAYDWSGSKCSCIDYALYSSSNVCRWSLGYSRFPTHYKQTRHAKNRD